MRIIKAQFNKKLGNEMVWQSGRRKFLLSGMIRRSGKNELEKKTRIHNECNPGQIG